MASRIEAMTKGLNYVSKVSFMMSFFKMVIFKMKQLLILPIITSFIVEICTK